MDVQTDVYSGSNTASPLLEQPEGEKKKTSFLIRILKNPLFLVVFTWVLMAFLLAFEVSGK